MKKTYKFIIGISGASGAIYAQSFIHLLANQVPGQSDVILSPAALRVYREEMASQAHSPQEYLTEILKNKIEKQTREQNSGDVVHSVHSFSMRVHQNIGDRTASGSNFYSGMIIVPCSTKTLGSIAAGLSDNLISRAADVCLKEKRKLILVVRETPFSNIHLKNMLYLSQQGVVILPASPGFYHMPTAVDHLVDFISIRILQQFNIFLGQGWPKTDEK